MEHKYSYTSPWELSELAEQFGWQDNDSGKTEREWECEMLNYLSVHGITATRVIGAGSRYDDYLARDKQ